MFDCHIGMASLKYEQQKTRDKNETIKATKNWKNIVASTIFQTAREGSHHISLIDTWETFFRFA